MASDPNKPHSYSGDVKDPSKVTETFIKTGAIITSPAGSGSALIPDSSSDQTQPGGGMEIGDGNVSPNPADHGVNKVFRSVKE